MFYKHIAEAMKIPEIIQLEDNLYVARFENMKLYSTLYAIKELLQQGIITSDYTVIDSSSGVYAQALAMACHQYKVKCHIIASSTVDKKFSLQLTLLGATVEIIDKKNNLQLDQKCRIERIKEIIDKNPCQYYWMKQYHDDIHYKGYKDFSFMIQKFFTINNLSIIGGVGTGCSTGGLIQYLRNLDDNVNLIGIQPFGSISFGSEQILDPKAFSSGIGSSIHFNNITYNIYDEIHWVSFNYSLSGCIELLQKYAIFAGLSSGCAYLVAQWAARKNKNNNYLFIAADTGYRYLDNVFINYDQAVDIGKLRPNKIDHLQDLTLPWSTLEWNRRDYLIN